MSERQLPFLPEDLITEHILVRVPVKAVGRFRCVSRPWRSLLSSPKFARAHLKIHTDHGPEGSILVSFSPDFAFCTVNLGNENRMVSRSSTIPSYDGNHYSDEFQGSCHGLVLVKQKDSLKLFNPITRETLKIPKFCNFSHDLGLGYDSFQDDYKIVCLPADATPEVGIYSVKMQTWRNVGNLPYIHCEDGGLFVNGCLHWPAWAKSGLVLAAFDLAREEFKELPHPKGIDERSFWCSTLTVLGGCIALVFKDAGVMGIWVMKEYGFQDSWTKYTLNIAVNGRLRYVGVMGVDEIVFVKGGYEELLASDWTGVSRNLIHAGIPCIDSIDGIANFRQSLISPKYR